MSQRCSPGGNTFQYSYFTIGNQFSNRDEAVVLYAVYLFYSTSASSQSVDFFYLISNSQSSSWSIA